MSDPLRLTISLDTLRHLGMNLYDSLPPVLSELVANAYDARAKRVDVVIAEDSVTISDDGIGMSRDDMRSKYLMVGRDRRRAEPQDKPDAFAEWPLRTKPMGRKGIGKLAMFSIASDVTVLSRQRSDAVGIRMGRAQVEAAAKSNGVYMPEEVVVPEDLQQGTRIVLRSLGRKRSVSDARVRKALSRRFSVLDDDTRGAHRFAVFVNGEQITPADWDIFSKLQSIWTIGPDGAEIAKRCRSDCLKEVMDGIVATPTGTETVSGWIGTVTKPSQLRTVVDGAPINDNRVTIDCRGKVAIGNFLHQFGESGNYASYLCGYIRADYLDDADDDIATSDRERMREDDDRVVALRAFVGKCLKRIQEDWSKVRTKKIEEHPVVSAWVKTLRLGEQSEARKLLAKIAASKFKDAADEAQIIKYAILAFERLRVRRQAAGDLDSDQVASVATMLALESDLENALYADIAMQRLSVVRKLTDLVDDDVKERVIQENIFQHMWLLEPSWTKQDHIGAHLEERVTTEFGKVRLSKEEEAARPDIRYRKSGGVHIIVELKRPSVVVGFFDLMGQVDKYKTALRECLQQVEGNKNPNIQVVCLLGREPDIDAEKDRILHGANVRLMTYDKMINETHKRFAEFVDASQEHGRIPNLIAKLDSAIDADPENANS